MADDQTQSGGGGVSSATVDAFTAASEDAQWNALGKMSAPAKAALLGALKTRQAAGTLKPAPTTPPLALPPEQKTPGLYDRATGAVLNFFRPLSADERAGIESHLGKVLGPVVEGVGNVALGAAQGTGSLVFHPLSSIYSSAQTAADALNQLFPDAGLTAQQKKAKDASLTRLKDQWHEIKDNPDFALGNLFGSIESGKIIGETVANPRETLNTIKKVPEAVRQTAQTVVGGGERQVRAAVETEAEKANTAAEAAQATRTQAKGEATAAEKSANSPEPFLEGDKVENSARQAHKEVVDRQKTVESKRKSLSDALEQTRQAVRSRLQNMKSAARSYFGQAYGDIEKAGGGQQVQLADLSDDMHSALEHVSGSEESTKTFKDIAKKVQGLDKAADLEGFDEEDRAGLAPDEQARLDEHISETQGISPGVSLKDLNGYYSELGRVVASRSTPGDLMAAAKAMQKLIDKRIKTTYGDELFKQNQLVRSQYRTFAQHFLDSDSNLAKAVDAPDAYHATQNTFLSSDARQQAVRNRVKTQLIGDAKDPSTQYLGKDIFEKHERNPETGEMIGSGQSVPSWRYRRQTLQQIEHMRDLQRGLDALPTTEKIAKDVRDSSDALAKARETARTKTADIPKPPKPPEIDTRKIREDFVKEKLSQWTSVSKFQLARLIAGPIGVAIGMATGHPWLELGGAVYTGAELTPFALQKLLDHPGVREWFTRPPAGEIETLQEVPHADRVKIADGLRGMIREADKQGKPVKLSRPVIAFIAANTRQQQSQQDQSTLPVSLEDLEKLNQDLGQPATDQTVQPGAPQ